MKTVKTINPFYWRAIAARLQRWAMIAGKRGDHRRGFRLACAHTTIAALGPLVRSQK
jgi:hypothetical protein